MGAFHEGVARPDDLLEGDDTGQGGVLHQGNDLVGHGGHDALYHLQKRDLEKNLPLGHAQHLSGLVLSPWNRLYAATVDLRKVAGVIDGKCHQCGCKTGEKGKVEEQSGTVVDDHNLQHQRGTSDNPDKRLDQPAQRGKTAHGAKADQQAQGQGKQQGQCGQLSSGQQAPRQGHGNCQK